MKPPINTKITSDNIFSKLPGYATATSESFYCGHIGPSMNPTLTAQDLLEIKPYTDGSPQIGDIILFQPPYHDDFVIHRIISITANGIQTRGDNNYESDSCFLKKKHIYGRVIAINRGERHKKIANGFWGSITGKFCYLRRSTLNRLTILLGPVYRSLCTGGILHWLVPVRLTPRVGTFQSDTNASHKLLLGKRTIGSYDESLLQWQIRRPYRLIVDESCLPKPK